MGKKYCTILLRLKSDLKCCPVNSFTSLLGLTSPHPTRPTGHPGGPLQGRGGLELTTRKDCIEFIWF